MKRKKLKGFDEPMRTCIGCREVKPKRELLRIALTDGDLVIDEACTSKGRGVYLCRCAECVDKAEKSRGVQRGFRRGFDQEALEKLFDGVRKVI